MAGETVITVVGNLTADPELKFLPTGAQVASFTVAATPRVLDRASNEWKDGDALFLRCSIWREAAEHVAESLVKGARVIVMGRLKQRTFETREGEKRTVIELDVDEIGPSLRYATAKVVRAARGAAPAGQTGRPARPAAGGPLLDAAPQRRAAVLDPRGWRPSRPKRPTAGQPRDGSRAGTDRSVPARRHSPVCRSTPCPVSTGGPSHDRSHPPGDARRG